MAKRKSKRKSKQNWIQNAIEQPGAFSKKAEDVGKSTTEYANQVLRPGSQADARTKKQANLARTLAKLRKKKRGK